MRIRTVLMLSIVGVVCVAVVAAAALAGFTASQRQELATWRAAANGIRASEEIELGLLRLSRLGHQSAAPAEMDEERAQLETDIRARFLEAAASASGAREEDLVERARQHTSAYLSRRDAAAGEYQLTLALNSLSELVAFNVAEAEVATAQMGRATVVANATGAAALGLVLMGIFGVFIWLRAAAFLPLFELRGVIERFSRGEIRARAEERGPAEIAAIAAAFNGMADQLAGFRERQMAFLAGVAHDLRAPLAPLKAAAAMGQRREILQSPDRAARLFEVSARQVDYLERMTEDLLETARIEGGQLQLRLESCDLRALASAAVDLFRAAAERRPLQVAVPDEALVVQCDPARIQQVLTNLVGNAIKYSSADGRIAITVRRDGAEAIIAIADQGVGIPPTELERIFEPFQRGTATASAVPGIGLGLATSRRLVQMHGGRLEVSSEPGVGSTFMVRLPVAVGDITASTVH
jgi:signal transduction histidine kinase